MTLSPIAIRAARFLLRLAIRPVLRRVLPEVFRELDAAIPGALVSKVAPVVIEGLIIRAVVKRTGMNPTMGEVDAIAGLFDPRRAARPLSIRNR
jgi:hypothetical protein